MSKPSIPEGVRDFSPEQVAKRTYIFETVKKVFIKYGFQPIETPTMEKLSTLTGKYGEEGDRLIFKILNNGLHEKKDKEKIKEDFNKILEKPLSLESITERALRYDLTVPFARYVVMHQNEITFPFKRYQIQPVWRADRPQKGRYREFYQCDVDVVGSDSLLYEAELVQIYDEVFKNLNLNVVIKINNRKILQGMAEAAGVSDKFMDMTIAIDKLDKIGWEGVEKELQERGINADSISIINKLLKVRTLSDLEPFATEGGALQKGIEELRTFHQYFDLKQPHNEVRFDITLARGLNYYTGCIFEVQAKDVKMGSIGGGGRYDDLTGVFGMKGVSGVGVSFGADRIYDCLQELDLFPKESAQNLKVIFVAFDAESHLFAFKALTKVREAGINAEIYPEPAKMKKQMDYANKRNAPFVAIIGSEELAENMLSVKNMATGEQEKLSIEQLILSFNNPSQNKLFKVNIKGEYLRNAYYIYIIKVDLNSESYYYIGKTGSSHHISAKSPYTRISKYIDYSQNPLSSFIINKFSNLGRIVNSSNSQVLIQNILINSEITFYCFPILEFNSNISKFEHDINRDKMKNLESLVFKLFSQKKIINKRTPKDIGDNSNEFEEYLLNIKKEFEQLSSV